MIIGRGSLASIIKDRDGAIFFCAGVGNSRCQDEKEFEREIQMLMQFINTDMCLFYFSSIACATNYDSHYFDHKRHIESVIRDHFDNYNIIRVGNIWECTNPNTFLNYFRNNPSDPDIVIRDENKYLISAATLNKVCASLPLVGKTEISVFEELLTVYECLDRLKKL